MITTGAYTVEHVGGVSSLEDTRSYGTNIDFLNHFGAANSSIAAGSHNMSQLRDNINTQQPPSRMSA